MERENNQNIEIQHRLSKKSIVKNMSYTFDNDLLLSINLLLCFYCKKF